MTQETTMDQQREMKSVFTIVENAKGTKSYWTRIGVGFVNRDGSITLKLDALPVNGTLQVREFESREDYAARRASGSPPPLPSYANGSAQALGS